jgi:LmbE family N-acetylglucosaminyl deacetylase
VATIVAFHAHPDDEVLLTGGTIAALAAQGHRVIIVMACDGDMWPGPDQGRRLAELRASAAILGADQAVHLGYADSGHGPILFDDPPGLTRFVRADLEEAAGKLAAVLTEVHADLLLSYDPQGGAPRGDLRPGPRGQGAPPAGQVALAGIPYRLGDGVVRRTRRTDG